MRLRMGGARKYYTRRTHTVQPGGGGGRHKNFNFGKGASGPYRRLSADDDRIFPGCAQRRGPLPGDTQHPAAAEIATPSEAPPAAPEGAVNINTATAAELETLPGIGEKRAADIVADRAANGPFRIPEDLTRVKGIGEGTLAGLIEYITVE